MPKTKTPKTAARVYRAASYARLSVDDESYGTSGSVLNQHAMIRDFADAYCAVFATPFHAPLLQRSMADCHVAMRVALIARGAQAPLLANTAGYALSRCACALTRRLQYG